MTLVELMVALAIGAFLILGAVTVFLQSTATFRVNDTVARLQENARFVLDRVEPDVRMARYFGLTARAHMIEGRAGPADAPGLGPAACGNNWTVDLEHAIDAANGYGWACAPSGGAQPGSDTLIVRRVTEHAAVPEPRRLYVQSTRYRAGQIFIGATPPADVPAATSEIHELVVNGYYVSERSSWDAPGNAVPSLRVKTLIVGPAIQDQEVLPGVEDMQVELGIDSSSHATHDGAVDRYVNPGDPALDPADPAFDPSAEIRSVRLWFRLRAENREVGFVDTARYVYADRSVGPFNDPYRRIVVSKTIHLRNAGRAGGSP